MQFFSSVILLLVTVLDAQSQTTTGDAIKTWCHKATQVECENRAIDAWESNTTVQREMARSLFKDFCDQGKKQYCDGVKAKDSSEFRILKLSNPTKLPNIPDGDAFRSFCDKISIEECKTTALKLWESPANRSARNLFHDLCLRQQKEFCGADSAVDDDPLIQGLVEKYGTGLTKNKNTTPVASNLKAINVCEDFLKIGPDVSNNFFGMYSFKTSAIPSSSAMTFELVSTKSLWWKLGFQSGDGLLDVDGQQMNRVKIMKLMSKHWKELQLTRGSAIFKISNDCKN